MESDEDTALNATGALSWRADKKREEAHPTGKNYRKGFKASLETRA